MDITKNSELSLLTDRLFYSLCTDSMTIVMLFKLRPPWSMLTAPNVHDDTISTYAYLRIYNLFIRLWYHNMLSGSERFYSDPSLAIHVRVSTRFEILTLGGCRRADAPP